jgi:hypothetical protein
MVKTNESTGTSFHAKKVYAAANVSIVKDEKGNSIG